MESMCINYDMMTRCRLFCVVTQFTGCLRNNGILEGINIDVVVHGIEIVSSKSIALMFKVSIKSD